MILNLAEDNTKSTKAIKQVFGQYSGPLEGDIKIVNPIVNECKEIIFVIYIVTDY